MNGTMKGGLVVVTLALALTSLQAQAIKVDLS